jgi:ABC-type antimicrobial peptide transport system ATPase subunit
MDKSMALLRCAQDTTNAVMDALQAAIARLLDSVSDASNVDQLMSNSDINQLMSNSSNMSN